MRARLGGTAAPKALLPPAPAFPDALGHVWAWFCEIRGGLQGNGWGCASITWRDLEAWRALTGETPEPWEARLLVRLGALRAEILDAADAAPPAGGASGGKR